MSETPKSAKLKAQSWLDDHNLKYEKVTAKKVSFADLIRGQAVFVTIHGWKPSPLWDELQQLAKENDFCVETG